MRCRAFELRSILQQRLQFFRCGFHLKSKLNGLAIRTGDLMSTESGIKTIHQHLTTRDAPEMASSTMRSAST